MFVYKKYPNEKLDERGWVVHRLSMEHEDTEVGYLRISYIPRKRFIRIYPSVYQYLQIMRGKIYTNSKAKLPSHYYDQYKSFYNFHVNKPIVDYIYLDPIYRGLNLSIPLYVHGSAWMKSLKLPGLYASGVQRPQAAKNWENMNSKGIVQFDKDQRMFL